MNRFLLRLHRLLGLAAAILLLLIGISGSMLVFRPELDPMLVAAVARPGQAIAYQGMIDTVQLLYPRTAFSLRFAEQRTASVQARVKSPDGERLLWLNPLDGSLLREEDASSWGFPRLQALHRNLLMGEAGEWLAAAAALALFYLCLSGLWFTLARGYWRGLLRRKHMRFRLHILRWHVLLGGVLAIPLLLAGLTGGLLLFAKSVNPWVNAVYGVSEPYPARVVPGAMRLPLEALIARADAALPGGRLVDVRIDPRPDRPLQVRKRLPGEVHPNGRSQVELDPYDGSVLRLTPYSRALPSSILNAWAYAWHSGTFGGITHRVLLLCSGHVLALLSISSGLLWAGRRRLCGNKS